MKFSFSIIKDYFFFTYQAIYKFYKSFKVGRLMLFAFALYFIFIDENSWVTIFRNDIKISELNKEIDFYKQEIELSKTKYIELNSNRENLEKFAREQFLMKKPEEDVFIINPDK
ncbi:MAG: septum formation initiator family protein [Bacteroidales bacterium]|nr:septum formation initiator family protein [Bacteroidales bacterium]